MAYGRALLTHLGIESELALGIPPEPDLVFCHNNKRIGLEHTRLYGEAGKTTGSFQAYENAIESIADDALERYNAKGLPPVEVKLFMPRARPSKARTQILSSWIAQAVADHLPPNPGTAEINNIWDGGMPEEIHSIRMIRFQGQASSFFFSLRAAWISTIDTQWLQDKIDNKARHLIRYRSQFDQSWLLMVEEQRGLASTLEIPNEVWSQRSIQPVDRGGFDRVFFMRRMTEVHEL